MPRASASIPSRHCSSDLADRGRQSASSWAIRHWRCHRSSAAAGFSHKPSPNWTDQIDDNWQFLTGQIPAISRATPEIDMYNPPPFKDDAGIIRANVRGPRLAGLVTATSEGPVATPMSLPLDESEG